MNWYLEAIQKKYADFNGRAHREEFWMFVVVNLVVMIVLTIIGFIVHLWFLRTLYDLAVLLPSLAVGTRRLHDTNRSGWWQLIWLVPIVGWIVLIVFFAQDSNPGDNQYGPNPRAAGVVQEVS